MRAGTHTPKWVDAIPPNRRVPHPRWGVSMEPIFRIFSVSRDNRVNHVSG